MGKWTEWDNELMEAILEDRPIQQQLDIAARELSNPIALFDTSFSLICYSGHIPDHVEDPIWKTVLTSGYSSTQALPREFLRFYQKSADTTGPIVYPDFKFSASNRVLFCKLTGKDGPFAILAMDELNTHLEEDDVEILTNIQSRLSHSRVIQRETGLVESGSNSVLVRLLHGESVADSQLKRMVSERHWSSSYNYQIMVIAFPAVPFSIGEMTYASIIRRLKFADNSFQYCLVDGNIVGIRHIRKGSKKGDTIAASGIRILESLDLHAGFSMWFQGYDHLKEEYEQGLAASHYAKTTVKRTLFYEDCAITAVLTALNESGRSLSSFCHPAVLALISGPTANRDLFETLYSYLDSGHHAARAAQMLGVHRNTVLYRLRNIEALTGLPLESPDDLPEEELAYIKLSCMLLHSA